MVELDSLIPLEVDFLLLVNVHDIDYPCITISCLCNDLLSIVHQEDVGDQGTVHVEEGIAALVQVIVQSQRWDQEQRIRNEG